jgi:integrase
MPKKRSGPTKSKQTRYYYFDEIVGFPPNKKRIRFSLGTKDPAKAQWLWEQEYKKRWSDYYGLQEPRRPARVRFVDICREFVNFERDIKHVKGWQTIENRLRIISECWGDVFLDEVGSEHIARLDAYLRSLDPPRSPKTINDYMGILKTLFYFAIRKKLYRGDNPITEFKPYPVDRKRREYTQDEIKRILEAAEAVEAEADPRTVLQKYIKRIILLLLYTGRRPGEIINLRWDNIKDDRIVLNRTETKQKREEIIPLTRGVKDILEGLKKVSGGGTYVIPRGQDRRITSSMSAKTALRKMRKKSGIKDFDLHSLRHTAASRLIAEGVDVVTVKELLGHSSIKTTEIYAHGSFDRKRKAIKILEKKARLSQD